MPITRALRFLVILAIAGCPADDGPADTSIAVSDSLTAVAPHDTGEPESSSASGGDGSSEGGPGGCGLGFCNPDGGGVSVECDIWAQDCPEGEKCMPWANDGGSSWNATRCSPLDPMPHQPGEICTVEGSGVSGIDDCDVGTMCWNVDPDTNQGVCVDFCDGSEANPICEDPATECSIITNEGVLILCLPPCDPLLQGCGEGEACYPSESAFVCMPDSSGDAGAHGDACEFINVCDPGLFCADAQSVFDCMGSGCCTEFCDLMAGDPDVACSGALDGETCTAWYAEGQAPPGLAHVGTCLLPVL